MLKIFQILTGRLTKEYAVNRLLKVPGIRVLPYDGHKDYLQILRGNEPVGLINHQYLGLQITNVCNNLERENMKFEFGRSSKKSFDAIVDNDRRNIIIGDPVWASRNM